MYIIASSVQHRFVKLIIDDPLFNFQTPTWAANAGSDWSKGQSAGLHRHLIRFRLVWCNTASSLSRVLIRSWWLGECEWRRGEWRSLLVYGENRNTSNSHLLLGPRRQESLCAAHFSDFHSLSGEWWNQKGIMLECYGNAFFHGIFIHIADCSYYINTKPEIYFL